MSLETQRAVLPLALGCLAVSGRLPCAQAAEWSAAPILSWTMDHASNRSLTAQAVPGEGAFLNLDAFLKRSTPTLELNMQPSVSLQRFTDASGSDTVNRSLNLSGAWAHERSAFNLSASYSDLSTLLTELTTTGIIQGNTRQRFASATASWQLQQSESRQLAVTLSDSDARYVGQQANLLPGYQYPSASLAERFKLSDRTSFTVSGSVGELKSRVGGNVRDEELSVTLEHSFSERFSGLAAFGRNDRSAAGRNHGYVGQFLLRRTDERNQWRLSYQRSVSPTGLGVLVQRDDASFSVSRQLAEKLNGDLSIGTARDNESLSASLLNQARRFESAQTGLNWTSGEASTVGIHAGYTRAIANSQALVPAAHGWQAGVTYTWKPLSRSISR